MRIVTTLLLFAVLVGTLPEQLQAALPTITLHPKSTTVIQDARVTISCQAFGASNTVIKWFKDGSLMPSSSFTKSYSFGRLSSQLTLSKASNSDQGSYRCEFSNTNEAVRSRSATLIVYEVLKEPSNRGREFYISFPRQYSNFTVNPYFLITASGKSATVNVFNYHLNKSKRYSVESNETLAINYTGMTESKGIGLTSEIIRIVSDQEIKVTAYQPYLNRSEASLIFPIPLYGKKYVIATYKPTVKAKFLILSHREYTHVNITFPKNTLYNGRIYNRSYPLNITLQKHQVFQFHSKSDLTGTIMQSNETVAIFSGNECANIPSQSSVCNTMFKQFLPASKLGQSYVLSTVSARNSGNIYRVIAAYDNTTVDIPSLSQTHTLNQGYYTEFELFYNEETVLVCDLPCLLVQFTIGGGSDSQRSDPFLTLVPAIEHYKSNYIVHIPSIATSQYQIYHNYLVVMIPASYRDGLLVNGNNLTGITWHTVFTNGSLDYACASIAITNATYTVSHVSDQVSFGLIQYGWSSQGIAYGFMGGIRENTTITTFFPPVITLQPDDQNNTLGQTIQLECTGISNPASTLVWLKNGIPIANTDGTATIQGNLTHGSLTISAATINDFGTYQCQFSNSRGITLSRNASIRIFDFKQVSSRGRDFCLGIYSQHPSANTPIPYILLTAYNQTANVIIFNNYFKSTVRRTLAPYETVAISISNFMVNDATGKTSKVFHVLSDHDITVKLYTIFKFTTDASLILPSSFYGKKYVAATYVPALKARILILAHQNDTTVSIRFPRGTYYNGQLYTRDRPLSIKLEQFQGFLYQINYDLTGTVIESDKGVAVITGNQCANVPVGVTFCDVLVQHLPPIEALGRNYILKALDGRKAYTVYRVIAAYDNTVVAKSYPFQTFILQRQGSFYEFQLLSGQGTNLVCDSPCLVVKYGVGITADSITGDPFMIAVPSVDDFDSSYIANVPRVIPNFLSLFPVNYLQVIVEESFKEGLTLNGTAFPKVNWLPIRTLRNKNYMVASIPVGIGTYKLANNNSNATFGLLQYAWNSQSTSYGLSAGIKAKIFISLDYPKITQHPESANLLNGSTAILNCTGISYLIPTVTWLKNGEPLENYDNITNIDYSTVNSLLYLPTSELSSTDNYQCRYSNSKGIAISNTANFYVYEIFSTASLKTAVGGNITLSCYAIGSPLPTITWMKSGEILLEFNDTELLFVENVTLEDSGDYRCTLSNHIGMISSKISNIIVYAYPIIENLTERVMVPRGKVIDLQCQGSSLTKPVMISWLKNNLILSPNQYIITQINITENTVASQLMINPATYNHSDIYRCRVYNPHAAVLSSNIAIVIQDPPNPVRNLSISNITADSISVSWLPPKHDGYSPIMNYTVELLNDQSLLVIKNCSSSLIPTQCLTLTTSATFQGLKPFTVYYLRTWANNVIGNSTASTLQVKTDEAAPSLPIRAGIALGYNSSSIQINWKPPVITNGILGYRVYQWRSNQTIKTLKNSILVYDGRSFQASGTNLEADHLYYYQIIPYNIKYGYLGIASEFINGTSHEDAPTAYPRNITLINSSSTSLSLLWHTIPLSDHNGVIIQYRIRYNATQWNHYGEVYISGTANMTTLTNLMAYTTYKIIMSAATFVGYGPESPIISMTTNQSVPSFYPLEVNATAISATAINVTWKPPPMLHRNGIITRYSVQYNSSLGNSGGIIFLNGSLMAATLRNLLPFTNYSITLKAATIIGFGPQSPNITVNTWEAAPTSYPQNLTLLAASSSTIYVNWQPLAFSDRNGYIINYSLRYNSIKLNSSDTIFVNGSMNSTALTNLSPFTTYNIVIRAATVIGYGPPSPSKAATTHQAVPSSYPTKSNVVATSATSLVVSWQALSERDWNGVITSFTVTYWHTSDMWDYHGSIQVNTATKNTLIKSLSPYTVYNVTIKAATKVGYGPESPIISAKTHQAAPTTSPQIRILFRVSNNSVQIQWQVIQERNRNGVILGYYLFLNNIKFNIIENRSLYLNETTFDGGLRNCTARNLKYFSRYQISLQAFTVAGVGPTSKGYTIDTLESVPTAPPQVVNIAPTILGVTTANVSWTMPPVIHHNGIIRSYYLKYFRIKFPINQTVIKIGNNTQHTLLNLQPKQNYSIQIAASTSVGIGPYTRALIYQTREAVGPVVTLSPQSVTVVAGNDVNLECRATSDPYPTVQWIKDGLPASSVYTVISNLGYSRLRIKYSNTGDSGSYQCQFTNVKGSELSSIAKVLVEDKNTTGFCLGEVLNNMRWAKTGAGQIATAACPISIQGNATRLCKLGSNGISSWEPVDTTGCKTPFVSAIVSLEGILDKQGQNATSQVMTELDVVTANRTLFGGDIVATISALEKINRVSQIVDKPLLEKFIKIQSNLFNVRNKEGWKFAEKFCGDSNGKKLSIMDNLEDYASKFDTAAGKFNISSLIGDIGVFIYNISSSFGIHANISFSDESNLATGIELVVPGLAVQKHQFTKLVIVVYQTLKDLMPATLSTDSSNSSDKAVRVVNSHVFSASLYPKISQSLSFPIRMTFINGNPIEAGNTSIQRSCSFWQPKSSQCGWSPSGCWMGSESNSTHTVCYCNHTTTFASLYHDVQISKFQFEVITYVGCGISCLLLTITAVIYLIFWRKNRKTLTFINLNIFVWLLLANIITIIGLPHTQPAQLCAGIATLLHFTILAAFAWMMCQAIHLVMQSTRRLTKKMYKLYSCIGYILPLVAAVATAVVTIVLTGIKNYLTDNVCWLRSKPLIISGFIGLTLSMTLITIMAIILASKNFRNAKSENLEKGQEEFSIYKHYLIRAFFLLLLIAVGWTLFVLFIIYNHIILQYAFAILSFLQGLYVFVFYGIQKIILKNDDWEKSSVKTMDTGRGDSFTSRRKTGPPEPDSINVYEDTDVNNVAYEEVMIETPPSSMEDSVRF